MKKITILGSTGSIGTTALKIVDNFKNKFKIIGLSSNKNIELLKKQIIKYNPAEVCISDELSAEKIQKEFSELKVYVGASGIIKLCQNKNIDLVIQALVGSIGIKPTIESILNGKNIALANKETLVCAGKYIMSLAKKRKVDIIPIDSEHSAILQCLNEYSKKDISKIILTASGGAFLNYKGDLKKVTVQQALNHPNWSMGKKVTVDSATLINKGFELIEAMHLFDMPADKIEIIIHPQSIIHSMVEFRDGVVMAQMSQPDMVFPIQFALLNKERLPNKFTKLNFNKIDELTFIKPDFKKFQCLGLAVKAARIGGLLPAVLCSANDVVVDAFLNGRINYTEIYSILCNIIKNFKKNKLNFNITDVFETIEWSKNYTKYLIETKYK